MSNKCNLDEIVTKFLLNTTRLRPLAGRLSLQAALHCSALVAAAIRTPEEAEADLIPLTTGSVAEFYIQPMLPHIDDIDIMHHKRVELAIPRGHSPPTQLPEEFYNYVQLFEIINSHLPGYVYLELCYLLTECVDEDKYNYIRYDAGKYLANKRGPCMNDDDDRNVRVHGPALLISGSTALPGLTVDYVRSVRCLSWPSQAADWPTRHEDNDWPDSATVNRVVNNGCDLVRVAHSLCRNDVWMDQSQCRLSFSRAEIVLISSFSPVQQIVYYMLRLFAKTMKLTDNAADSGSSALSNYHIKTLMLWACEMKPKSWWSNDLNLIGICVDLLHTLADWLIDVRFPHYFVNNCNLTSGNSLNLQMIASELMSIDEAYLSTWFANNCIGKCAQLCPDYISRLFLDVGNSMELQIASSAIVHWKLGNSLLEEWNAVVNEAEILIVHYVPMLSLSGDRRYDRWINDLAKLDAQLSVQFTAVARLQVAGQITRDGFSHQLIDTLATILGQPIHRPKQQRYASQGTSEIWISNAAKLMKVVANNSRSTAQLIEIELCKAYLYRALRCKDSDSDSIYCLANVYLAVLHCTTAGQYQTAIDHCALVTMSHDHLQCSSHLVQGEILPKIDDDIDNVLGLAVFYQHVRSAAFHHPLQMQHFAVFTTELFAHYLRVSLMSNTMCRRFTEVGLQSTEEFYRYKMCTNDTQDLLITDIILFILLSQSLTEKVYDKAVSQKCQESTNRHPMPQLISLLQKSAVNI